MILILDNYDSFTYNLYQAIHQKYAAVRVVRNDKISIADIQALSPRAIILSPGPGTPERAGICVELIKSIRMGLVPRQTPVLGVCLGHQAIMVAFGGRVVAAPQIVHGRDDIIFHNQKGLYQHLSLPFQGGRYHSLIVDRSTLADELVVEAENAEGLVMGIRHRTLPIYGVQFHPESILTPEGNKFIDQFLEVGHAATN